MPIPLFTTSGARAIWEREPYLPPVEPWEAKGYALGLNMAKELPSPLTAAIEGLKEGEVYQEERQKAQALIAKTQAEAQKAAVEAQLFPESEQGRLALQRAQTGYYQAETAAYPEREALLRAQAEEARVNASLTPQKQMLLQRQQEVEGLKLENEQLKQKEILNQQQRGLAAENSILKAQDILTGGESSQAQMSVAPDYNEALTDLEKNIGGIVESSMVLTKNGVDVNGKVNDFMRTLPDRVPEEYKLRAENLRNRYQQGYNDKATGGKKELLSTPTGAGDNFISPPQFFEQRLVQKEGIPAQLTSEEARAMEPPSISSRVVSSDLTTNDIIGGVPPRVPQIDRAKYPAAYASVTKNPPWAEYTQQNLEVAMRQKIPGGAASELAWNMTKPGMTTDDKQMQSIRDIDQAANLGLSFANDFRGAFRSLQNLIDKNGGVANPHFGPGEKIGSMVDYLSGAVLNEEDAKQLVAIKGFLTSRSRMVGMTFVAKTLQLGTRAIDTEREQAIMASLGASPDLSLNQALGALALLDARTQEGLNYRTLYNAARNRGYTFDEATQIAQQYITDNPAITMGTVNGEPASVPTPEKEKENIGAFLTRRLATGARRADGRIQNSAPATNTGYLHNSFEITPEGTAFVPKEPVHEEKNRSALFVPGGNIQKPPPASEVPENQINGANDATMNRLFWFESRWNPKAKNEKSTASGLGQLIDSTGKMLWKQMGFYGEYDPFDPQKNAAMSTFYMNTMLATFEGNTRLALSAYTGGIKKIRTAQNLAYEKTKNASWENTMMYLPDNTPEEKAEKYRIINYVKDIMDDGSTSSLARRELARVNATAAGAIDTVEKAWHSPMGSLLRLVAGASTGQQLTLDDLKSAGSVVQSELIGAAQTGLYGNIPRIGAWINSKVQGIPYEQAFQNINREVEKVQKEHPALFAAGKLAGPVVADPFTPLFLGSLGAAGRGLGIVGEASPVVAGGIKVAPEVGKTVLKNMGIGAAYGGLTGFFGTEGSTGNRLGNAAVDMGISTVLSGILGLPFAVLEGKVANQSVHQALAAINAIKNGEAIPKVGRGARIILDALTRLPKEEITAVADRMKGYGAEAARLVDAVGANNLTGLAEQVVKNPEVGLKWEKAIGGRLVEAYDTFKKALAPYLGGMNENEAQAKAAEKTEAAFARMKNIRSEGGNRMWAAAEEAAPGRMTLQAREGPLTGGSNLETKVAKAIIPAKEISLYSDDILAAMNDEKVLPFSMEANKAVQKLNPQTPPNSFKTVDETFKLINSAKTSSDAPVRGAAYRADAVLREAVGKENPLHLEAMEKYSEESELLRNFTSRGVEAMRQMSHPENVKDIIKWGQTLVGMDTDHINSFMNHLNEEERQAVRKGFAGFIHRMATDPGTALAGNTRAWPDFFTRNQFPEKLKIIFGPREGEKLANAVRMTGDIVTTMNRLTGLRSETAPRMGHLAYLAKQVGRVVHGVLALTVFKLAGTPTATRDVFNAFTDTPKGREITENIGELLITNRPAGLELLDIARKELERMEAAKPIIDAFDKWAIEIGKTGGTVTGKGQAGYLATTRAQRANKTAREERTKFNY